MAKQSNEELLLNAEAVDRMSELCAGALEAAGVSPKDRLRMRLSLEEVLLLWQAQIPGAHVRFRTRVRKTRTVLEFSVAGNRIDPGEYESELLLNTRLRAQAGFPMDYFYAGGRNLLIITPPRRQRLSNPAQLGIAVALALLFGLVLHLGFPAAGSGVQAVISPLLGRLMGLIKAVSSPLIFLVVCGGILGMGDLTVVGRIGRVTIRSYLTGMLVSACTAVLLGGWLFPIRLTGSGIRLSELDTVWASLLQILPGDIVTPFAEGNILQIIFMAVFTGVILILLAEKTNTIRSFVHECSELFFCAMELISRALPFIVFLSVMNLLLMDQALDFSFALKLVLLTGGLTLLLLLVLMFRICLRFRVSPLVLCRKLAPVWLIGLSTSSSSAALSENLRVCETKLGISGKLTGFGLPLGQITGNMILPILYMVSSLCMAELYQAAITPAWLITAVLLATMMGFSTPPVAGGPSAIFALLFVQLGIPAEAAALAATIALLADPVFTVLGMATVQLRLILIAGKLRLVNEETLRKAD